MPQLADFVRYVDSPTKAHTAFEASADRQRALAYVWITVGSALKDYASDVGIRPGEPPFAAVIGYRDRLAHQALDRLDVEIVWETSINRATLLLHVVEGLITSR